MSLEERSKRIRVFRNGDIHDRGRRLVVNPRVYRNFEQFLSRLSKDLNLVNGAARRVYALENGHPVTTLEELADGAIYIASAGDPLKKIPYQVDSTHAVGPLPEGATIGNGPWNPATIVPRRRFKDPTRRSEDQNLGKQGNEPERVLFGPTSKAYKITVFQNGETTTPGTKMILNYRNCRSYEQLLRHMTELLRISVRKLYDAETGGRISSLRQIRDGQNMAVATSTADGFKRVNYQFSDGRRDVGEDESPRICTFFPNGDILHIGQTVPVTKKMFPTMQRLLDHLNAKLHMLTGQIHKIYSLSGQRQQTVEDLVHGGGYVVVPNNDSFIHARYNTNALNTRHSYHHGAAKDGTGTDGGSSDVPTRRVRKLRKRRKQTASASEDEAGEKVQRRIMHRRETGGRLKEEEEHEADTGYQTDVTTIVKKGVVKKKPAVTALTAPDPTPPPAPAPSTVKAIAHAQMLTPGAAPPPRPQQVPVKREVDEPVYDDLHRRIQPTTTTTTIVTASQPVYGPQTHDEAGWVQSQPRLDASSIVKQYIEPQREVQHHGEPPAKKEQKEEAESRGLKGKKQPQQQTQPLPIPPIPAEPMPTEQPQHEIVDSSGGSWYVSPTAQRSDNTQPAADIGTVRITDSEETGEPGEPQGYFTKGGKWLQGQAPQQQQLQQEVQSPQTEESGFTFVKKSNAEGYFTKGTKKPAQQQPSSGGGGGIISKTIRKTKQGDTTTEIDEEVLETPDEMVATQRIVVHGDANDMYGESSQIRVLKSTAQQEQQQQSSYSSSPTATRHGKGEEEKDEEEEKETEENEYETVVTTTTAPARGKRRTLLPGLPRKKTNS